MANMEKLMLWGAAGVMAAVGSLSVWKISRTPRIAPQIAQLNDELTRKARDPRVYDVPPPVPAVRFSFIETVKEPMPVSVRAGTLTPKMVGIPIKHPPMNVQILPFPVVGEAKADLNGVAISWTLLYRPEKLRDGMTQTAARPTGFLIQRQCEDGPLEDIARVGPKESSFTDLSTEPRLTYRYWVQAIGEETRRSSYPAEMETVVKGLHLSTEARTPTATRVKLVGGDRGNAILRVETYDRTQKKWIGKLVQAVPGKTVGTSGWTLKALKFDNFTLVAELTDDEGVDRVLNTGN